MWPLHEKKNHIYRFVNTCITPSSCEVLQKFTDLFPDKNPTFHAVNTDIFLFIHSPYYAVQ